jgi:hypothetical protein
MFFMVIGFRLFFHYSQHGKAAGVQYVFGTLDELCQILA